MDQMRPLNESRRVLGNGEGKTGNDLGVIQIEYKQTEACGLERCLEMWTQGESLQELLSKGEPKHAANS